MTDHRLYSRGEAAGVLHISTRTLDRMIAQGVISVVRIGGRVLVDAADLDAYIDRCRVRPKMAVLPPGRTTYRHRRGVSA